jgi:hypothetical protein
MVEQSFVYVPDLFNVQRTNDNRRASGRPATWHNSTLEALRVDGGRLGCLWRGVANCFSMMCLEVALQERISIWIEEAL